MLIAAFVVATLQTCDALAILIVNSIMRKWPPVGYRESIIDSRVMDVFCAAAFVAGLLFMIVLWPPE